MDTIHVSPGNTKLGKVPSISLDPWVTCDAKWPCADKCYAKKIAKLRPNVRYCWLRNTNLLLKHPKEFERQARAWLQANVPKKFRWTVGGEWFRKGHQGMLYRLAKAVPKTQFFMYTRKDTWDWSKKPKNLHVFFSYWLGDDRVPAQEPWAVISEEKPSEFKVHACNDGCEKCNYCTSARKKLPVWFKMH